MNLTSLCSNSIWEGFVWLFLGLCPDWDAWDPKTPVKNATEAIDAAEQWLDVPQVT